MDERHWWIAGKIQESFHIGGYDNPTLLEDFLCEPDTLELINEFLNIGGPRRLFFYCDKPESGTLSTRQLHIVGTLAGLKEIVLEDVTVLYLLRHHVDSEVDPTHMEKDIYCGELKGNVIDILNALLSEIYVPLLKAKKDWGHCSADNQMILLNSMDKYISSLNESSAGTHSTKQWMLRQPDHMVGTDFKQHRLAALDQQVVSEYEAVVQEWMTTIDTILNDVADERLSDLSAGPMSELERWKRRHRLLTSITEQLKSKECKTVIGVLITGKSKLLKKWKLIDTGITDAMNETKDKVRYLESMKRHFEQLYHNATPASMMNTALPGILGCIKQMDSVSRFYARQGFLGLLFTKITNQLVMAMKEYIKQCTVSQGSDDHLWEIIHQEILQQNNHDTADPNQRLLQTQLDSKFQSIKPFGKKGTKDPVSHESLLGRLKACLVLASYYRDGIRSLRDSLGAAYNLSRFTSLSSLAGPPSLTGRSKVGSVNQPTVSKQTTRGSTSPSKKPGSVSSEETAGHGVSVADEEAIMAHMDAFCSRLRQVMDIINTMAQFHRMAKGTANLPRPRKEDLVVDETLAKEEARQKKNLQQQVPTDPEPAKSSMKDHPGLGAIAEDEEAHEEDEDVEDQEEESVETMPKEHPIDYYDINMNAGLSREDVDLLKKYYPSHSHDDGPSVMAVLERHTQSMSDVMIKNVTTMTMLDVESKDQDRFEEIYSSFLGTVQDLEKFLAAYLRAVFTRKVKTTEALDIMTRFIPIHTRSGVRSVVSEKFVEIFNWYEGDLHETQHIYEKQKEDPPILRNAPPVAGAIYWSRQLLKRIEEPMKVFRENKAVTSLKDFSRIVKKYNRLATALVTFESLWFTHWKTSIDHARSGLRATLFIHHPDTKEILINADERVLELIQEAKWLTRQGVTIPEAATQVMQQELRFKGYKDHLELCLQEFTAVLNSIPLALRKLFQRHIDKTLVNFQPGLTTLSWNSMNIDAFLHQIHTGTNKLQYLVQRVNHVLTTKVENTISSIRDMFLFDYSVAFSKSWHPSEFVQAMGDSISEKSQKLNTYINTVELGIKECANILTSKKSRDWTKSQDDISSTPVAKTAVTAEEQHMMEELLEHYVEELYQAVLLAITHSLVTLAESSGCAGEVIRGASAMSTTSSIHGPSRTPRPMSPSQSHVTSACSEERPVSVLSLLSSMTWTTDKADEITYLRFQVSVRFDIPNIMVEPALSSVQTALSMTARNILAIPEGIQWCGKENLAEGLTRRVQDDEVTSHIVEQLATIVNDLEGAVKQHIFHFSLYDFLWKDDMRGNYYDFIRHDPGMVIINREVERLLKIEQKVSSIPSVLPVGPICLHTSPIKDALHGFAMAWKSQYASIMHDEAKHKLDNAVLYRSNVRQRLEVPVTNLDQLNSTALLLDELADMENKIDDIYLPIETMYAKLRSFELRLARTEVQEVDRLRNDWQDLLDLAEDVRQVLLKERRGAYEQELDKQIKTFVVEVIQFRNAFDAQGPSIPGIPPAEAVARLQDFQQRFALYSTKRKTLDCVSKLFGIVCKPFPELDKTGEELELLGLLYGLFQKFIGFDQRFRETLWSEVDLQTAIAEVESYWDECLALPSKLKDWDAYHDMKSSIQEYLDVFPLLDKLASKEIRNRHWLQVMAVTGSSFQLEANVFKLSHLLDIGLLRHRVEIEDICRSANRELELEVKLRMTEEEWTEQVLNFEHYKRRGPMYLDKSFTERLLEQLEDAQALLAQMLTSRHIGPLREEAASWAEKLKEVGEVLEQWLEVQDLWQYLEAVFSNSDTAKELPQEAKRFARIDKGWTKMMKRAYDTRNVLQCCYGGEVPKGVVLRHIHEELEVCFKSLAGYLDNKRRKFPRFYFLTDPILVAVLSKPKDLDSVRQHLRSIFSAVHDVHLEQTNISDCDSELRTDTALTTLEGFSRRKIMTPMEKARVSSVMSSQDNLFAATPGGTKIDKRLTAIHSSDITSRSRQQEPMRSKRSSYAHSIVPISHLTSTMLPSEILMEESSAMEAVAVQSIEGEVLRLKQPVGLEEGVEEWLNNLQTTIQSSLHELLINISQDVAAGQPCEEWALKFPTQVCRMGMLYYWTKECEQGIVEIKYDRKSLGNTSRKFGVAVGRLPVVLARGSWRNADEPMTSVHKTRLEAMITQSLFLRDMIDNLSNRKLREPTDFEWRRCLRFYIQDVDDTPIPQLHMLDQQYSYGNEFYGAQPQIGLTPAADKCYLSMSQAVSQGKGALVTGNTGVGKTETVKGLAQTFGKFLVTFQSSTNSDPTALGKLIQGLAMAGCWGCFDDVQKLSSKGLAILMDHVQAVLSALRSRLEYCTMGDGQEVVVDGKVAFFMTYNPFISIPKHQLPNDVRASFRQIGLSKPNFSTVLKAKCSSLGLKAPTVLAMRLKLVAELARDQLHGGVQHDFSISALTGVLLRVSQRRRNMREEKSSDKMDARALNKQGSFAQEDLSRSNSQMSMAPSTFPIQQSSSMMGTNKVNRKGGSPNPLSAAAKLEHALVGQMLLEIMGPRLTTENYVIFKQIIKDIFAGLPDPPVGSTTAMHSSLRNFDIESAIDTTAQEKGLVLHKPWVDKCLQLYSVSQVHQGIIVAGPPGSGKSTLVQTLVDALCVSPRGLQSRSSARNTLTASNMNEANHKLQKLYPLVVDDLDLMFGHLNQNHDWVDGIFTLAWKKASRNQSTTWLCLDGPLNPSWVDTFSSVLDVNKALALASGDSLHLSNNVRLLFETDDLSQASPSLVARTGVVFVDKNVVGWRPIAKAWLENRSQHEVHVLQRAFDKTVDAVSHFVSTDARPKVSLSEVGMFQTCISLLSAMLADNIEIGGELHIERLYLFCLMWSFGGLLEDKDRKSFNDLIATLSTALPDDDRDICFFDYYVDESGEWDPWHSRVPEAVYNDHDLLGRVFIDTVDTIRTRLLMEFACAAGQNVLLVGSHGSGKTAMVHDFLDTQDPQKQVTKRLVYSGASCAQQLQHFIEANIYHRQGFVYGAKENKKLQLFIDDLNLPAPDKYGVQRPNELLRRVLDDKVLCTLQKPFEWRTIEDLVVLTTMSMSQYPSMHHHTLAARLMRHFAVFALPAPQGESLKSIVQGVLEANMTQGDHAGLELDLHNAVVTASCKMLQEVQLVLRPTPMPGRHHYLFTLKQLFNCFLCLRKLPEESRAEHVMVVSLWKHEMERLILDQICRFPDQTWFEENMKGILSEMWPDMGDQLHQHFVTFHTDDGKYQQPVASVPRKQVEVVLQPVASLQGVHTCLQSHLNRYNEEFGNEVLDIRLSDNIIAHIIRIHRILSYSIGGNILYVGPIGSHLGVLCKLALHVANIPIHPIDNRKQNIFLDGLRSAVRLTGAEGKKLAVFFNSRDLHDELYLDAINSLLVSGEYPYLFSNDEMDGLLQALGPAMKREYPTISPDPHKFFVSRVQTNLHIIICLPPGHRLLQLASSQYPGLLSGCQLIWMADWTKDTLLSDAAYYISQHSLAKDCDQDMGEAVMACLANIHSFVLQHCQQTKWAGDTSEEIAVTQVKPHEKKKDQLKTVTLTLPNRPYSKSIMLENIKLRHRSLNTTSPSELYVGPTMFCRFMDTFRQLYTQKASNRTKTVNRLKKVLMTLSTTRQEAKAMKESIKDIHKSFESAKENTAQLLHRLTERATVLEKLKAKVGIANSLSAFLQLNELSDEEEEDNDLLQEEERDEYDAEFDRMREANLRTRQVQAKEEYADALKLVEDCKAKLGHAKEQVLHWRSRVDRQCIDRVKNFQNPPMLVGQVMEMVMTLIGKRMPAQRLEPREHNPGKEEHSSRFSTSSSSTRMTANIRKSAHSRPHQLDLLQPYHYDPFTGKTVKDPNERFDRQSWKAMQIAMSDSVKFVDMLHNVSWDQGLTNDVVHAVEGFLAQSREGHLGVTGEGTLLDNAAEKEKSLVAIRRSPSPENSRGITIAAAKYSSEDVATLVQYTIAIVEYTRRCGPLKAALERKHDLEREIEENERIQREKENEPQQEEKPDVDPEPEEDLGEEDLPRIQGQVDELQAQFDAAVVEKHSLELELASTKDRLRAATEIVNSLKGQEEEWQGYVEEYSSNDILIANCLAAAGFLVYCGPFITDTRKKMGEFIMTVCEHHKIPLPSKQLFRNMELANFLYSPIELHELEQQRLPRTRLMLENAAFVMQGDNTMAWPLLCDPTSKVIDWIMTYLQEQQPVRVRYSELKSQFDTCLADGLALLVTDVDVQALAQDSRFFKVLHSRSLFTPGRNPFKIMVGDHEVECNPGFRLYLHTTSQPHLVPGELAAYVTMIYFHQTRQDIEEELLDRFMTLEKPRINDDKKALLQEHLDNMRELHDLEQQMISVLSSDVHLLENLAITKKLADLKKQHDEAVDSQQRADLMEDSISRAREGYRIIAQRGAVCFDTIQYMREVDPLYQISFSQFLSLYEAAISHSDRTPIKAVVERLTQSAFMSTIRALKERDKSIFTLLLSLEIEDANGRVGVGEREFLVTPALGSIVMTAAGLTQPPESKFVTAKKPFDWMSDDQFNNLQILAIHYDWFQEMFDRMPKDGRETQWRTLCENDQPETQVLPDKMDEQYTPLQRLLVIRAVRSDRIMQLSTIFINSVLGKKYSGEIALDLPAVLRQSSSTTPVLMLYTTESETAERAFHDFATKKQCRPLVVALSGLGLAEEKNARKFLQKGMEEGLWVLLQNGHNAPHLLGSLESLFAETEVVDPQFRCWITAETTSALPVHCLQKSVKITFDTPRTMKETMVRAFNWLDADALRQSSRPEWPALLHNLCYLHAAVRLRARLGRGGWNQPADFLRIANSEFMEALQMASQEFRDPVTSTNSENQPVTRSISWTGMRFTLAEVIYGSYVTDPMDQYSLGAMIDYWISPNAVKKDFELARLKYKHPAAFFSNHPRLSQLVQALENLPSHSLETPEACNIHPTAETVLGDDQYVFTRLNKVYDAMPSSATLSHQLFSQPPTPLDAFVETHWSGDTWAQIHQSTPPVVSHTMSDSVLYRALQHACPPVAGVSGTSNHPQVVNMGVYASAAFATLRMRKEVELWEVCHNSLSKVPRAYSKEYVAERIKKIGGMTPFNIYIMKELDLMYKLLTEVKTSLQQIKTACEVGNLGDELSPSILSVADDLYHMRLPETWCRLSGDTAPPPNHSLNSWLSDLTMRSQHFERILVLGREKMPAYWLGAFFQPRGLLAQLKQDAYRSHAQDRSGNLEQFVFQTEVTGRDKDHIRDPPSEGLFVFGIYMWGCAWEKTTMDLHDTPPKHNCSMLPVVHVTCWPQGEKPLQQDPARAPELYSCPVYQSRIARKEPIMELDVQHNGIPATRWALRGLSATIRPY